MTWSLWRALRHPPTRNPLFARAYASPEQPAAWYIGCAQWAGVVFALPVIALAALIYGIGWSVGIANLISKERAQGTFTLLRLCPSGPLGMSWAIATGYLYHHRTFKNINAPGNLYSRVTVMAVFIVGLGLLFELGMVMASDYGVYALMLRFVAMMAALYVDHVQSLALAALAGMAAGSASDRRANAQLYAFTITIGCQLATYLATFLIGFSLIPALFDGLGLRGWLAETMVVGARLLVFYATRETLMVGLWVGILKTLNPDRLEIRALTRRLKGVSRR